MGYVGARSQHSATKKLVATQSRGRRAQCGQASRARVRHPDGVRSVARPGIGPGFDPELTDLEPGRRGAAIEAAQPRASERRITIDASGRRDGRVRRPHRIRQVLDNLISNAVKYNHDDGHVEVSATSDGLHAWIVVRDDGAGIAEQEVPRLFEAILPRGRCAQDDDPRQRSGTRDRPPRSCSESGADAHRARRSSSACLPRSEGECVTLDLFSVSVIMSICVVITRAARSICSRPSFDETPARAGSGRSPSSARSILYDGHVLRLGHGA